MFIFPELKLIFIRPHKVAGQSLTHALLIYLGYADGYMLRYRGLASKEILRDTPYEKYFYNIGNMSNEEIRRVFEVTARISGHSTISRVKEVIPKEIWDNYLKISIVRCPYDTMISMYYWNHRRGDRGSNFNIFTFSNYQPIVNCKMLCIRHRSAIDFIIRYENIEEDILKLERKLEVPEGGILKPFKSLSYHEGVRLPEQDVCKVYSKYPLARAIINERMNTNMDNEIVVRYYPIYKERLDKQIPPVGYFTKKTASRIYNFRIKYNDYLHKLYRLSLNFSRRKDKRLV